MLLFSFLKELEEYGLEDMRVEIWKHTHEASWKNMDKQKAQKTTGLSLIDILCSYSYFKEGIVFEKGHSTTYLTSHLPKRKNPICPKEML
jgi:hypothetical protein